MLINLNEFINHNTTVNILLATIQNMAESPKCLHDVLISMVTARPLPLPPPRAGSAQPPLCLPRGGPVLLPAWTSPTRQLPARSGPAGPGPRAPRTATRTAPDPQENPPGDEVAEETDQGRQEPRLGMCGRLGGAGAVETAPEGGSTGGRPAGEARTRHRLRTTRRKMSGNRGAFWGGREPGEAA